MASRNKKQSPGLYARLNISTQLYEERPNRALRRRNLARARKVNASYRAQCKAARKARTIKASGIYYE